MVTLRDVARAAGVSPATASRALSGSTPVSSETRERVTATASAMGYQVNALARSLRTQRSDTIGLLLPDVRNPFFTELAYHVDKAADEHGLTVMIGNADERADQQDRYLEVLARRQVDGIIAVPQGGASEALERIAASTPLVFIDRDPRMPGSATVTSDNEGGMRALVDHVVGHGHRRIGVVAGPQSTSTGRERLLALVNRLAEHGVDTGHDLIVEGDFGLESGVHATETLLDRGPLDAIIAADNLMALGALMVLRRRHVRVGTEVALACVDDVEWFSLVEPALTVVAQDVEALGRAAVASLVTQISGDTAPSVVVPMQLIARASCGEQPTDRTAAAGPRPKEENHG